MVVPGEIDSALFAHSDHAVAQNPHHPSTSETLPLIQSHGQQVCRIQFRGQQSLQSIQVGIITAVPQYQNRENRSDV